MALPPEITATLRAGFPNRIHIPQIRYRKCAISHPFQGLNHVKQVFVAEVGTECRGT